MSRNSKNARRITEAKQISAQRKARKKMGKKYEEAPRTDKRSGKVNTLPYPRKPAAVKKDKDVDESPRKVVEAGPASNLLK